MDVRKNHILIITNGAFRLAPSVFDVHLTHSSDYQLSKASSDDSLTNCSAMELIIKNDYQLIVFVGFTSQSTLSNLVDLARLTGSGAECWIERVDSTGSNEKNNHNQYFTKVITHSEQHTHLISSLNRFIFDLEKRGSFDNGSQPDDDKNEQYQLLLKAYLQKLPQYHQELVSCYRADDYTKLTALLHTLKGSSGCYQLMELSSICEESEALAKQNRRTRELDASLQRLFLTMKEKANNV